jgi:hypothetical protein
MAEFTDSTMLKEDDRLTTFDKWPVSFISKNNMEAARFYFLGRQDWVRCPFCGVQIGDCEPSPVIDAGPRDVVSRVGNLPTTFLSVLTPSRVWL